MNKLTKGAIAGAAGIVLLMGGAGSLAYWTGSADLTNGAQTINAGSLSAATTSGSWTVNGKDASTTKVVPGAIVRYDGVITVTSSGDGLKYKVNVPTQAVTSDNANANAKLAAALGTAVQSVEPASATGYTVTGSGVDRIYSQPAGPVAFKVSLVFTWPFGTSADNDAQNGTVSLSKNVFTATQQQ
jgi:alternate signal-mediated exported protein